MTPSYPLKYNQNWAQKEAYGRDHAQELLRDPLSTYQFRAAPDKSLQTAEGMVATARYDMMQTGAFYNPTQ